MAAFHAVILGTLISALSWFILAAHPTVWMCYVAIFGAGVGRDRAPTEILRIYFAAGTAGPAGDVYGVCVFAAGDWVARRWVVWWKDHASLRGGHRTAASGVVRDQRDRAGHGIAVVDLRSRREAEWERGLIGRCGFADGEASSRGHSVLLCSAGRGIDGEVPSASLGRDAGVAGVRGGRA